MISIVVVCHSRPLAEAAVALARQMIASGGGPSIGVAAGIDSPEGAAYGTDAGAVAEALTTYDSPDGVLVLMDIGSSVLSAQLALEFLDPEHAARVRLCSAPLVEGLVPAVVAAAGGGSLERAAAEARAGLAAKQQQVGDVAGTAPGRSDRQGSRQVREVPVTSPTGLHLRPAAVLVHLVQTFDAQVRVSGPGEDEGPVGADSIAELLTLGAAYGDLLRFEATGPQAAEALDAIEVLAATGFEDYPSSPGTSES